MVATRGGCGLSSWLARIALAVLAVLFVVFAVSVLWRWNPALAWHDQQRILQLLLLGGVLACFWLPMQQLPVPALCLVLGLFLLGALSTALARYPQWAVLDWARYVGLVVFALVLGGVARRRAVLIGILLLMTLVGIVQAWRFLLFYLMAFLSGMHDIRIQTLATGFTNIRTLGQFQSLLMPIVVFFVCYCWQSSRRFVCWVLFIVLSLHWCIAYATAGRGVWLGILCAHAALLLFARHYWRLVAWQGGAALLGGLLFGLLFNLIPDWLGIESLLVDLLRTGLSYRDVLWMEAWRLALGSPWLGVGPMHFALEPNPFGAHPHQVVLQWSAEWGFPAALMMLVIALWGLAHGGRILRQGKGSSLDAAIWLSIAAGFILAQVDGVFVMPYTEVWLASLVGLALARWARLAQGGGGYCGLLLFLVVPSLWCIGGVLLEELPVLVGRAELPLAVHHIGWRPRFWVQGWLLSSD